MLKESMNEAYCMVLKEYWGTDRITNFVLDFIRETIETRNGYSDEKLFERFDLVVKIDSKEDIYFTGKLNSLFEKYSKDYKISYNDFINAAKICYLNLICELESKYRYDLVEKKEYKIEDSKII